jgi:hypothetical protein
MYDPRRAGEPAIVDDFRNQDRRDFPRSRQGGPSGAMQSSTEKSARAAAFFESLVLAEAELATWRLNSGGPQDGRVDHLGSLAEILRTYHGWRDRAERLHLPNSVVIKSVNGASPDAQCLPRPDIKLFFIHSPGQHSVAAVDRLLVMVVAMRWSGQTRPGQRVQSRDAAGQVLSGEYEAPSGPRRMVSSDGLTRRLMASCVMWISFS